MVYKDNYRSPDSSGGGGGGGGDITGVSAGNGLTGGGTTGDVALAVLAANASISVSGSGINLNVANANTWTGVQTFNPGTSQATPVLLDMAQPGSNGQRDSHILQIRGTAYDGTGHNADWQIYADVTSNAGASTLTIKSRIDAIGFATRLTLTDAGALSATSATLSSLTSGRVTFATTSGLLTDASTLTFNSGTGALAATSFSGTSVTASALTSGRVTFASTAGLLADSSALTFSAGTLSSTSLQATGLTSGRVPFVTTGGLITDDASLTYSTSTGQTILLTDSATNAATTLLTLDHRTSGTAAANYGTRLLFRGQDASATGGGDDMVALDATWSTATSTSEVSQLLVKTRTAGGALATTATFGGAGTLTLTSNFTCSSAITFSNLSNLVISRGSPNRFGLEGASGNYAYLMGNLAAGATSDADVVIGADATRTAGFVVRMDNSMASGAVGTRLWALKFDGREFTTTPNSAPTDADLSASNISFYLDEAGSNLKVRVKYADGTTLKTGILAIV